jgi:cell division transport system ATP-binding protein
MIEFSQVTKRYPGGFDALSEVDFSLKPAEMVFLTGHSGAGKSTFLKLLALLDRPSTGQILLDGQSITQFKSREVMRYRRSLGITFQLPHLLNDRSVFDNVALPLIMQGADPVSIKKRVHSALDKVGLLSREQLRPLHLSGGEQQRVGIARAIVHKPRLLIADEPTGNLDPALSREIINLFVQFNQVGVAVVIATHDVALIASMKYRIVMLKKGRMC